MTTTNSTQIMWTCVPNGVVTTSTGAVASPLTLQLSVVVTPKVVGPSTIKGTIFQDWPAYVRAVTAAGNWLITFGGDYVAKASIGTDHISASSDFNVDGAWLWQAIFPFSTPVLPTQTSASPVADFKIHSFDAGAIATAVRSAHRYAVQSHLEHGKLVLTGSDPYSVLLEEQKKAKRVLPKVAPALRGASRGAVHHTLRRAYEAETGDVGVGFELMRHALYYDHDKHRANLRASRGVGRRAQDTGAAGTTPPPANDFNTLLAHLGGQPKLLRKLGLVIDLQLTLPPQVQSWVSALPVGTIVPPAQWKIQMTMPNPTAAYAASLPLGIDLSVVHNVSPMTSTDLSATLFRTAVLAPPTTSVGGSINSGFLPLGDPTQYTAYTEDTEGTPIKLDIAAAAPPPAQGKDIAAPFPALRTSGVAISQIGRDAALDNAFTRQGTLASQYWIAGGVAANATLFADDTIRGYAIDVEVTNPYAPGGPSTTGFQSICKRNTRMYFPTLANITSVPAGTAGSFILSDEGYTKASAANAPDGADELDLHSALWGWEGWSLAAQRPGRAITSATPAGDIVQTETPLQPTNAPATNFPTCQFNVAPVAGSLPRLRFGYTYSFRARVLDIAGNDMSIPNSIAGVRPPALTVTTAATPGTPATTATVNPIPSPSITYLRYEPVPNPVIVLQAPLTEGEHVENLVIRSNPWGPLQQNAKDYASYVNASKLAPMNQYQATSARWVAPPKGSWSQAEQMGAFDANFFDPLSQNVTADLKSKAIAAGVPYSAATFLPVRNALFQASQKEAGLFTDTQVWDSSNTTATSASGTNDARIVTPPGAQNLPPPTNPGQPLAPGQYNILVPNTSGNGPQAYLPYLPDANAKGIAIQQLDGNGNPTGTKAYRTYASRPGCTYPETDMPQFVLADAGVAGEGKLPSVGSTTNPSGLDNSSPSSAAPITFELAPGQAFSFTYGSVVADVTKMANSDINASATGNAGHTIPTYAPFRTISMVHAVQQPKPPSALASVASWQAGFGVAPRTLNQTSSTITGGFNVDTLTSQSCDFTASWVEYLDVEMGANVTKATDGTNIRSTIKQGRLGSWTFDTPSMAATPISFTTATAAGGTSTTVLPPFELQFGDTKTRLVTFQATATTRFREFFPASLQSDATNFQNATPLGTLTAGQLLSAGTRVPSSARPKAPEILYVVPTFGWTTGSSSTSRPVSSTTTNTRTGRGLRVFVSRPWFTTGDNEQLAVLVNPLGSASTALAGLVSQWGMDPIRNTQGAKLPGATVVDSRTGGLLDQTQIPSGTVVTSVPLAETNNQGTSLGSVSILTFNPSAYDEARQLWYFDVEFAANAVEAPFVRLALARYQTNSLGAPAFPAAGVPDLRMSTVVLADMVKLAADRTASYVVNSASTVTVTVSGQVFADSAWTPAASVPVTTPNPAAASGRMVFAQILETTVTNPGEFDWKPLGGAINLTAYQTPSAPSQTYLSFIGSIPKPATLAAGTRHQLLITELEVFTTDQESAFPGNQTVNNFPQGAGLPSNTSSRVVFSDILPLPY